MGNLTPGKWKVVEKIEIADGKGVCVECGKRGFRHGLLLEHETIPGRRVLVGTCCAAKLGCTEQPAGGKGGSMAIREKREKLMAGFKKLNRTDRQKNEQWEYSVLEGQMKVVIRRVAADLYGFSCFKWSQPVNFEQLSADPKQVPWQSRDNHSKQFHSIREARNGAWEFVLRNWYVFGFSNDEIRGDSDLFAWICAEQELASKINIMSEMAKEFPELNVSKDSIIEFLNGPGASDPGNRDVKARMSRFIEKMKTRK